ncbi:MAG: class I SAM-dependent methyltransferase [Planctomycetota bacterium]|jgi:predicted O-methyltransferase YrrM
MIKKFIKKLPFVRTVYQFIQWQKKQNRLPEDYPRGHFYSPLPDISRVRNNYPNIVSSDSFSLPGIDLREDFQQNLLHELEAYFRAFDFQEKETKGYRYYSENGMFGKGSALVLYSMIRHFQPKRIIEIGSGYTSALMLDVNEHFMDRKIDFTFIEPYPERLYSLLREDDKEKSEILTKPLQEVPKHRFEQLKEKDFLFIDSSHVSKIGSDVNRIVFEILPLLHSGVIVHFHDIYWPFEYPLEWIELGRAWNEAYLLRAFLQYNKTFEILLFNNLIGHHLENLNRKQHLNLSGLGSSIWLQKR